MNSFDFTEDDIGQAFDEITLDRGQAYYGAAKVLKWQVEGHGSNTLLRAQVAGNREQPYLLWVQAVRNKKGQLRFTSECSCPMHGSCKHVVAALFAALPENAGEGAPITPIAAALAKLETQGKSRAEVIAALQAAAAAHTIAISMCSI